MIRGIERRKIFRNKKDREDFLYLMRKLLAETQTACYGFVLPGKLNQGRRDELVGGGLIRSLGGWSEVKKLRSAAHAHMMSDERILEESDFVASMLSEAGEIYERRYELL